MAASAPFGTHVEPQVQSDPRTDPQLITALNGGDADAFESLYRRHRDWVMALAHRFTGSEDLALDVMQETFLYLLRKFPGFRLTANLKTFLYPAVKNLAIAARRKAARVQSTEAEQQVIEQTPAPESLAIANGDLATALANLSPEHREVLLLRFVDDLPLAEIAVAVSVPLGTVKSRLHHALEALRQDKRARGFFEA
jgi:RNA polymerase sigma-70 factor, ECF subfamily